ncbi:hypothetical protein BCR43DRAFT_177120 [Syncephalastrum racemosum]|uniref:Uncharacterized protein n=1 Tax=Syncephalastrum racemosum TaxID=13706 RepID=A0A1X2HR71_SYNRA|nr:hypothetical protein BCR43DRAFT_177120 [Syncephalastrum racemosum]
MRTIVTYHPFFFLFCYSCQTSHPTAVMMRSTKTALQLDAILERPIQSTQPEILPPDISHKALALALRRKIRVQLARTSPDKRRALEQTLLCQSPFTPFMADEAAALLQEQVRATHFKGIPITAHTIQVDRKAVVSLWRAIVQDECLNASDLRADETPAQSFSVISIPVPISDVLRQDLPNKDAFFDTIQSNMHAITEDAQMLESATERVILHYAGHGLGNTPWRFRPDMFFPRKDQIRNTDYLDTLVKPLDLQKVEKLLQSSLDHQMFLSYTHVLFIRMRVFPSLRGLSRSKPHPFWKSLLDATDFPDPIKYIGSGKKVSPHATTWVKNGVYKWWYSGKAFKHSLHNVCQVLLWLRLAPHDEKQIFVTECMTKAEDEQADTTSGKPNKPSCPLFKLLQPTRVQIQRRERILLLSEHLKHIVMDDTFTGALNRDDIYSTIDRKDNVILTYLSRHEIDTLCYLANRLRLYAPRYHSPCHPLLHIPFVVMANTVLRTAGYPHLAQPLFHKGYLEGTDNKIQLSGTVLHDIFFKEGPYELADKTGRVVTAKDCYRRNYSRAIIGTIFDRDRIEAIGDEYGVTHILDYPILSSNDAVIIQGFRKGEYTQEEMEE